MQSFPHRLGMAAQCLGDLADALSLPAAHHHLGVKDPVGWRMYTVRQFATWRSSVACCGRRAVRYFGILTPSFALSSVL